jgi:hypothetical protein
MGLLAETATGVPTAIVATIAALIVIRFALKRYIKTTGEYRFTTYPSLVVALGLGSYAFSGVAFFFYGLTAFDLYYKLGLGGQLSAAFFLSVTCFVALQKYWGIAIAAVFYVFGEFGIWVAPILSFLGFTPQFTVPWLVLNVIPIIVFGYLAATTKRTTIVGLFAGSILLLIYGLLRGTIDVAGNLFYWVGLLAYGLILVCFLFPEQPFTVPFFGYAGVIVLLGVEAIWLLMFYDLYTVDLGILIYSAALAIGVAFAGLGATHMYPRVRKEPHLSTLFVWIFFIVSALSGLTTIIWRFEAGLEPMLGLPPGTLNLGTLSWYLALFASAFMAASALYAMEWRAAALFPFIPTFASFIVTVALFANLRDIYKSDPAAYLTYQATLLIAAIFFLIPVIMYFIIGRRLSPERGSGRARAFGLAIGLIVLLPAGFLEAPIPLPEITWLLIQGVCIFAGYTTLLAAVTGWLDKLLYRSKGAQQTAPGKARAAESAPPQPAN